MESIAGLPDVDTLDQRWIGVNVLDECRLFCLLAPKDIALKVVVPNAKCSRIRADLEGNAYGGKPSIQVEAPLSHGRIKIASDAAFHRAAKLLCPAILQNGNRA